MADPAPKMEGPDIYPWEWPTDEQKAWFDAQPVAEQWRLVDEMLQEAFKSGPAQPLDIEEIIAEAKARRQANGR